MGLKEVLQGQGVALPPDFDERYAEMMSVLRGGPLPLSPQTAGAEPVTDPDPAAECNHNDFVCKSIKRAQHSQGLIGAISAVYGVATILSQLEKMPLGGPLLKLALNVVSATLKGASALTDGADKVLGKLPFFLGYLASVALYLVYAVLQLLLGLISFSREKHAEALKAMISIVPFVGIPLANAFETANGLAGETDESAGKLMADLDKTFTTILSGVANLPPLVSERIQEGRASLQGIQTQTQQGGRKRFSRRRQKFNKWRKFHLQRTRRHRFGSLYESGLN